MRSSSAVEEPPHNKKEKVETSTSCPLSSLPNGVGLSCLARVSPSDYGALSHVSKRYRSLVVSPELYKMRSVMGLMEKRHYVCLSTFYNNVIPRWFILRRDNTKFRLIPIPSIPPQAFAYSSVVVLDWGIYVIGGWISQKTKSTDVLRLDCRTHTWRKLPSMAVARSSPAAGVIDGKIYVFGGCNNNLDSSKWGEVFDPKTQTWDTLVPLLDQNIRLERIDASLVIENKLYAVENSSQSKILYFSPSEGKWGIRNFDSEPYLSSRYVMVDNLLYLYSLADSGKLFWCEKDEFEWKEVKGLDSLHMTMRSSMSILYKLIKFGENIVVFWKPGVTGTEIWCAEISLERREEGDEIWGKVEWSDSLTTLDHHFYPFCVLSYSVSVNL